MASSVVTSQGGGELSKCHGGVARLSVAPSGASVALGPSSCEIAIAAKLIASSAGPTYRIEARGCAVSSGCAVFSGGCALSGGGCAGLAIADLQVRRALGHRSWRRMRDSNSRGVAPNTLSKRAP